jgi:hypothetical protein
MSSSTSSDREPRLELGRLHVGDETRQEAALEAVFKGGDRLRRAVGREHDLFARAVEVVERVEELLLEALLVLHELDVVHEEDVALAVAPLEGDRGVRSDGVDELVHERLGRHVANVLAREVLPDVVADGVEQVGLAQPRVTVDEQWVVRPRRVLGDGLGGGVSETVRRADDERTEAVAGVEG